MDARRDMYLRQVFQNGADVKELSAELKRTREAIRARLKKLRLME